MVITQVVNTDRLLTIADVQFGFVRSTMMTARTVPIFHFKTCLMATNNRQPRISP
jgi:hypothetical protein